MTVCDKVIVTSEKDYTVEKQLSLAKKLGMEVEYRYE